MICPKFGKNSRGIEKCMARDGKCTNPGTRRVASRRKMQDKWRRSPRWKALLEAHAHTPEAVCVYLPFGSDEGDGKTPSFREGMKSSLIVMFRSCLPLTIVCYQ
jgi:hypothetical protein